MLLISSAECIVGLNKKHPAAAIYIITREFSFCLNITALLSTEMEIVLREIWASSFYLGGRLNCTRLEIE